MSRMSLRSTIAKFKMATEYQKKLLEELEHDPKTLLYLDVNLHIDDVQIEVGIMLT